ncbi:protein GVQW3-like [Camponotus floridanus]|uniref:protein GVQW3-like n=1 Tax=Camponotus floridanus TaxID=104421 RepID=UPI000DC6C76E|nr:protein GVQW3-like [Camponotus floridanus]
MEQRVNLKFLVKLGKTATEAHAMLKEVYGSECLSRTQVFEWCKRFKEGREMTEDDPRSGRPLTSKTEDNIEKIGKLIRENRRLSIRTLAEVSGINRESIRQILHESLNMRKVCAKMVPKLLTAEQKELRMNICVDLLNNISADPGLLDRVITCDESWFFTYDPETKRQSMHWKSPSSPRQKKAKMSKSKFKTMMVVFF